MHLSAYRYKKNAETGRIKEACRESDRREGVPHAKLICLPLHPENLNRASTAASGGQWAEKGGAGRAAPRPGRRDYYRLVDQTDQAPFVMEPLPPRIE